MQTAVVDWLQQAIMLSMQAAELQTAIQLGSVQEAQLIARQLAEAKAKVIIRIDEASTSSAPDSDIIRYNIHYLGGWLDD